jgi:hypothetical protein
MTVSPVPAPTLGVAEEVLVAEPGIGTLTPVRTVGQGQHPARSADDQVHVVIGAGVAPGRTLCGQTVLVVYEHQMVTTCPACTMKARGRKVPTTYEPCG